ncbi:aminomethyl-transferring glycine dehydrogenase [Acidiferrobacter sp. SPIII_3]|uniref:aminomethyl-transferring glycine dehydrogenase subunit GcvPA n=1 Tax=Acidiferrobacter sp. SPIII_3 TaxID=1281578 RepID=UPI000D734A9B|nr:aminomethyl-transferring glycine dehydrogenase subunit GcvPA [Acidiferrobacter sp. SPIII_3]AWP24624.1 aminomethyl-transferring glycine dehydrogenase [Acidiferrobacter sp. SPIII_3]
MPFTPHTAAETAAMLETIGARSLDDLFDEIPARLRSGPLAGVPQALTEQEIGRLMRERAAADGEFLTFVGAGAYEHHIPAAVWEIAGRGEFYTAYTPYQAEASQGTLQLLYEFQTMIASLVGLDCANASLYDGASALAEAVLMAVRLHGRSRRVLIPETVHPLYRKVVQTIVSAQSITLDLVPMDAAGITDAGALALRLEGAAGLVIPQPNFLGCLEDVHAMAAAARAAGVLAIGLVNPIACALIVPPGEWGPGCDIAVGEGQPLGAPLSSGGPYFGFMACRREHVRQMPGRIVGRTVDVAGHEAYTLTLQAREQHIRRSRATSNICTNQGLLVTAATVHMALLGPEGLRRVAAAAHANTAALRARLTAIPGVRAAFPDTPFFHEVVLRLPVPVPEVLRALEAQGILGGCALGEFYPAFTDSLLVCATETKTETDIAHYAYHLERIVTRRRLDPPCAYKDDNPRSP